MKFWALLIAGAVAPFLFKSTLPSDAVLILLVVTCLSALPRPTRVYVLFPLAFLVTTLAINQRLSQKFVSSDIKRVTTVTGAISNLPEFHNDYLRFIFEPIDRTSTMPARILVYWYKEKNNTADELPVVQAGETWRLELGLRSARSRVNFSGSDAERWYFTDGIVALGYVKTGNNYRLSPAAHFDLNHRRELVREKLQQKAGHVPAFRTLVALAIADRRDIQTDDRRILSATGTGHLLAISGLHIGLAASMGFYFGRLLLLLVFSGFKQRIAIVTPWILAWMAALSYAALADFTVSTQRALIMLSVTTLAFLSRRAVHPALAWLVAMALVLAFDPFAPLRAGFWFSFMAVAVLMMLFVPRQGSMPVWKKMLLAQVGISLLMAPLGMYWFQQASLPGLLANLIAIPIISMLTVPLILLALVLLWTPGPLVTWLLTVAGYSVEWLFVILDQLSSIQPMALNATNTPAIFSVVVAMFGALILLLPRGVPLRLSGLLLMIPMLLPASRLSDPAQLSIDFLDVGQGLAVLVASGNYLLLYDTGPGSGEAGEQGWNLVNSTIEPAIKASAMKPNVIVVSHADLDHSGGLRRLQALYPDAHYIGSLPKNRAGIQACRSPNAWKGGELSFSVLHPSIGLPYLGNDSSCVISARTADFGLLLSGDVSRTIEQRLSITAAIKHDILTVPHHGSSTSSSMSFLRAVAPKLALISAASNNRFGFPRKDVTDRYAHADIATLNTADCGGIRIFTKSEGGFRVESARTKRAAIWRWPATAHCP